MPNLKELWTPSEHVVRVTEASYVPEIVNAAPDQVWLLLFAKSDLEDFSIRAKGIYDEIAPDYPQVKFGFVDINRDEYLKVTFDVESVPWTFCIYGGRAYRFPSFEVEKTIRSWLDDLEQWKQVKVQLDLPTEVAGNVALYRSYVWKDYKRCYNWSLRTSMELTGSETPPGGHVIGLVAAMMVLMLLCMLRCMCKVCRKQGKKEKTKTA